MPNKNGSKRVSEYDVRNCGCEKLFGIKLKLDNKLNFENHIIDICIEENFRKIYALVRLAPYFCSLFRGVATGGGGAGVLLLGGGWGLGCYGPPTSLSESNKVQEFQFQTSGILLFTSVLKF